MDATISDLLIRSALIAVGFLLAVAFYESLSTRDVLVARAMRLAHRLTGRRTGHAVVYGLTVLLAIPLLVLLWTVVLEFGLIIVGSVERIGNVAFAAVSVVAAARMLAYARERTSHELAKAIPLAFAFAILTGGAVNVNANLQAILAEPDKSSITTEMVVFLLALEIGLRLLTDGSHALLTARRERSGSESHLGFWRTVWSSLRRSPVRRDDRGST